MTTYWSSRRMGCTMRSGEYDLMAPAAVGEHMTWERSAPYTSVRAGRHWLVCKVLHCAYYAQGRYRREKGRACIAVCA